MSSTILLFLWLGTMSYLFPGFEADAMKEIDSIRWLVLFAIIYDIFKK